MSTGKRNWTADAAYWIGVAMTLACFALVLAGNTDFAWRFEHVGFPLSWTFAGLAILAFLMSEFCYSGGSLPTEAEDQVSQLSPEWEAADL